MSPVFFLTKGSGQQVYKSFVDVANTPTRKRCHTATGKLKQIMYNLNGLCDSICSSPDMCQQPNQHGRATFVHKCFKISTEFDIQSATKYMQTPLYTAIT